MTEPIDDLLARIPPDWDFWIGSLWDADGTELFQARLQRRAPDHPGHYGTEIEHTAATLRAAIEAALADLAMKAAHRKIHDNLKAELDATGGRFNNRSDLMPDRPMRQLR